MVYIILKYIARVSSTYAINATNQGRIQNFKLGGGGGGALRKIAPSGGRRENFGGISCEKSRFYAKKSYFFQLRREARKILGYFVWKITIIRQKIIFFPILGGGGGAGRRPPLDPPLLTLWVRIPLVAKCSLYNIRDKVCQWLATGRWFFRVFWFPPPINLTATI